MARLAMLLASHDGRRTVAVEVPGLDPAAT
jgi:hypothetical protein